MDSTPAPQSPVSRTAADVNWRRFVAFRVLFNARFYYPVFAVMFLDYGLTVEQFTLLNFVWSIAIVCLDLPAGALADHIGRRPLVIGAAVLMVVEMAIIAFVPVGHPWLVFWVFLANRIVSGMAEAFASGADEALVFDSLAEQNRSDEWPQVLDQVMRWQAVGFVVAMLAGGAVYDPVKMQRVADALGFHVHLTQQITMRFPIYLTLITACFTLLMALGLREPVRHATHAAGPASNPFTLIKNAGRWILRTPFALLVIVAGFLHDSVIRLFMTFGSAYYRLIALPSWTFGIIGAAVGALGFLVSPLGRKLVNHKKAGFNFGILVFLTLGGLTGVAMQLRFIGVVFAVFLAVGMYLLNFFVSYYLNAIVDTGMRATVLSFKGLAFNLGYGGVSLLYAGLFKWIKSSSGVSGDEGIFARSLPWLPVYFAATILLLVLVATSMRKRLENSRPPAAST